MWCYTELGNPESSVNSKIYQQAFTLHFSYQMITEIRLEGDELRPPSPMKLKLKKRNLVTMMLPKKKKHCSHDVTKHFT